MTYTEQYYRLHCFKSNCGNYKFVYHFDSKEIMEKYMSLGNPNNHVVHPCLIKESDIDNIIDTWVLDNDKGSIFTAEHDGDETIVWIENFLTNDKMGISLEEINLDNDFQRSLKSLLTSGEFSQTKLKELLNGGL